MRNKDGKCSQKEEQRFRGTGMEENTLPSGRCKPSTFSQTEDSLPANSCTSKCIFTSVSIFCHLKEFRLDIQAFEFLTLRVIKNRGDRLLGR